MKKEADFILTIYGLTDKEVKQIMTIVHEIDMANSDRYLLVTLEGHNFTREEADEYLKTLNEVAPKPQLAKLPNPEDL